MASQNTFVEGLDPTPLGQVSASQLLQIVREADPAENLGLVIHQEATPDIDNNPWMARCYWRQPISAPLIIRVYDKGEWKQAAMLPADNSIVNSMIKDGEITDSKIVSLSWSKLVGDPPPFPITGEAGGDLTGTYPKPIIANSKVTTSKLANYVITGIKIAPGAVGPTHILNGAITSDKLAGDLYFDLILPLIATGEPIGAGQSVRRNSDNTKWEVFVPIVKATNSVVKELPAQDIEITLSIADIKVNSFEHGLIDDNGEDRLPLLMEARFVCITADDEFVPGDEISLTSTTISRSGEEEQPPCVWADKSFVFITVMTPLVAFSRAGFSGLNLANWKLKVYVI